MSKLTDSARGENCIRCDAPHAYGCHYNGVRQHDYGKGRGIKATDLMVADFCHRCDQIFSEGTTEHWVNKWERSEEFLHWIALTIIRRLKNGVITIR